MKLGNVKLLHLYFHWNKSVNNTYPSREVPYWLHATLSFCEEITDTFPQGGEQFHYYNAQPAGFGLGGVRHVRAWFQKYFWSSPWEDGECGTLSPLYQLLERCCHKMTVESLVNCWLSQVDTSTHVFNAVIRVGALGSSQYLGIHWRSPALSFFSV